MRNRSDNAVVAMEDWQQITINVAEQNLRPTISGPGHWSYWPNTVHVGFGSPQDPPHELRFSVSANDSDDPAQNLTYSLVSGPQSFLPAHGSGLKSTT